MSAPRVLCIANQKGGTGKTTSTATIGAGLAAAGRRVLLVDLDPQSSLTQSFGINAPGASMAEVIGERGHAQTICKPIGERLDLAPSDIALAGVELQLVGRIGRELAIKQSLAGLTYDIVIIDCPPALSLLTVGALVASQAVIIPTLPAAADLRGVRMFLGTIEQARELNPDLQLLGLVVVQYDERLTAHRDALETIKSAGLPVLATIPRSVRVQEAGAALQPITIYSPGSRPAEAYNHLTKRIDKWLKGNRL